jgi:hypothetical protein
MERVGLVWGVLRFPDGHVVPDNVISV